MKKLVVAFDVDETLILQDQNGKDYPNYPVIELLRWFKDRGHAIIIWSGGGEDYATMWAQKLGFPDVIIVPKTKEAAQELDVDIAVDDSHELTLGKIQIFA